MYIKPEIKTITGNEILEQLGPVQGYGCSTKFDRNGHDIINMDKK